MPLQIVYAPYKASIQATENADLPLLFYRYESDSVFMGTPRFMRISNTRATLCSDDATLYLSEKEKRLCDFHTNLIHKMASTSLEVHALSASQLTGLARTHDSHPIPRQTSVPCALLRRRATTPTPIAS